jgi:hypothetical protein
MRDAVLAATLTLVRRPRGDLPASEGQYTLEWTVPADFKVRPTSQDEVLGFGVELPPDITFTPRVLPPYELVTNAGTTTLHVNLSVMEVRAPYAALTVWVY